MKQNKLAIVALIVIAVLFVLGLSSDFFRSEEDKDDDISMRKVARLKDRWVASLDGVMASFRDRLETGRLEPRDNCSAGEATFKLTGSRKSCTIAIAARRKADAQKAVLAVTPANVKVWIPFPEDEPCPTADRGAVMALGKFKQPKATIGVAKIKPGRLRPGSSQGSVSSGGSSAGGSSGGSSQHPLRLNFIYTPAGKNLQSARCEAAGEVNFVVLEQGGTLSLECKGCDKNRSITVALE